MGLQPGAGLGVGTVVLSLMVPFVLILAITADRGRARREAVDIARQATLRRQELIDETARRTGPDLPALVGSLAVRLRMPLADISAETAALRRTASGLLSANQLALLDAIRSGARRMQDLNERLLDYAAADSTPLQLGEVNLTALAAESIADRHALSNGRTPRIAVRDLPTVRGDVSLLRQVFYSLIKNAVEHAVPGRPGRVTIVGVADGPSSYRIEVADCGTGIPAGSGARLFDAFYRHADERSLRAGLGLAVVRRVVQRHGGSVGVDANTGGGSRFWFSLPIQAPASAWPSCGGQRSVTEAPSTSRQPRRR